MQAATVLSITVAGGLAVAVIALKYEVAYIEHDLVRVNRAILNEQRGIHVLNAEWNHLNDPARLAPLATQVLAMRPVNPAAMRTFMDLPFPAPPVEAPMARLDGDRPAKSAPAKSAPAAKAPPPKAPPADEDLSDVTSADGVPGDLVPADGGAADSDPADAARGDAPAHANGALLNPSRRSVGG